MCLLTIYLFVYSLTYCLLFFTQFDGSTDRNTKVKYQLENPILAMYLRIRAVEWNNKISMKLEVYGCRACKNAKYIYCKTVFWHPESH